MFSSIFSNRVEVLFESLKEKLFVEGEVFSRRLVVVSSPIMKNWIHWHMANDSRLGISMGIEFCYVNEAISKIMKKCGHRTSYLPSFTEIALMVDAEVRKVWQETGKMTSSEQAFWEPLFRYMGTDDWSKKLERKLLTLSKQLARNFQLYGLYGGRMVSSWEKEGGNWQQELWRRIFCHFSYPFWEMQNFNNAIAGISERTSEFYIHLFAISFLPKIQFDFFSKVGEIIPVHYYVHSPCHTFWSDTCSDQEIYHMQQCRNKWGISFSDSTQNNFYLMDRNPLLANSGKLGREMAKMFEDRSGDSFSKYVISAGLLDYEEYRNGVSEEILVENPGKKPTLLEAVQADLVLLRSSKGKINISENKQSIQVHVASSRMREIEILYNNLLELIYKEKDTEDPIIPNDIIVMAPDITLYEGFIKAVFLRKESYLDVQIYDIGAVSRSLITQEYLQLLNLAQSRWEKSALLRLVQLPHIRKKFEIDQEDISLLQKIIQESGIQWGKDAHHRSIWLTGISHPISSDDSRIDRSDLTRMSEKSGLKDSESKTPGTWDFGIHRAFLGVIAQLSEDLHNILTFADTVGGVPLGNLDMMQAESIGKWAKIFYSLHRDLKPLAENVSLSLKEWSSYLISLLEAYFLVDREEENEIKAKQNLTLHLEQLVKYNEGIQKNQYPWMVIDHHLQTSLHQETIIYRENHAQSVRFCSMLPMRAIPAKVIYLIGMNEENFPKKNQRNPLNLLTHSPLTDYCPKNNDYDRYLFLEAILSARRYFSMSYVEDRGSYFSRNIQPSVLISELLEYLDERYESFGKKISSSCIFRHPFHSFDPVYFRNNFPCKNYSEKDYKAAIAFCTDMRKISPPIFSSKLSERSDLPNICENIEIEDLIQFAKNPLKYFFNHSLGIYIESEYEERPEFQLSPLNQYLINQKSRTENLSKVLSYYRKMGKMPIGTFDKLYEKKLYEKKRNIQETLHSQQISCEELITIDCERGIHEPQRIHETLWKMPSINVMIEGHTVRLVGRINQVNEEGLWIYGTNKKEDLYKHWPLLLIVHWLKKIIKPQVILLKSGSVIPIDFSDHEGLLINFIKFYRFCSVNMPFLLPELIDIFLDSEISECKKNGKKYLSSNQSFPFNPYAQWIFKKMDIELMPDDSIATWKHWAQETYGNHIQNILKKE